MKIASFLFCLVTIVACTKSVSPEQQAVDAADQLYKATPSDSTAEVVIEAMNNYINVHGYADSTSARFLIRAAKLSTDHRQPVQAVSYYKTYILQYPDRPDKVNRIVDFITLSEKSGSPELNDIMYASFANTFPNDQRSAAYKAKINNPQIAADSMLRYIGINMFNDSTFRLNQARASLYVEGCEAAVLINPTLPNAAGYLYRAAETAGTLRNIPKTIELYDWITVQYPLDKRASTSLFLKAFTLDNEMGDFEQAGKLYNEFLEKYPNDEFAESAKFLLDNLGISEAELKKKLDENNKNNVQ